jgi:hypothetical protein
MHNLHEPVIVSVVLVYPLDKGRRRRDLIKRVMSDIKVIRKSLANDKGYRLLGSSGNAPAEAPIDQATRCS